jgi:hypothetical protein
MTLVYNVRSQKANNITTMTTPAYDPNIPSFDDVPFIRRFTNCEMYRLSAPVACGDDDNTTVNWSYQDLRTLMSPYVG